MNVPEINMYSEECCMCKRNTCCLPVQDIKDSYTGDYDLYFICPLCLKWYLDFREGQVTR